MADPLTLVNRGQSLLVGGQVKSNVVLLNGGVIRMTQVLFFGLGRLRVHGEQGLHLVLKNLLLTYLKVFVSGTISCSIRISCSPGYCH